MIIKAEVDEVDPGNHYAAREHKDTVSKERRRRMGLFDTPPPMLGKRFGCMDAEEVGARWGVQTAKIFGPLLKEVKSAEVKISLDTDANGVRTTKCTLRMTDQSDNRKAFTGSYSEGPDGIHGEWATKTVPQNSPAEEEDPKPPGM